MDGFPDELPVCLLRLCGRLIPLRRIGTTRKAFTICSVWLPCGGSFVLGFPFRLFPQCYVMSVMKVASGGRRFSLRAVLSSVAGETADSLIFFPIALGGLVLG